MKVVVLDFHEGGIVDLCYLCWFLVDALFRRLNKKKKTSPDFVRKIGFLTKIGLNYFRIK